MAIIGNQPESNDNRQFFVPIQSYSNDNRFGKNSKTVIDSIKKNLNLYAVFFPVVYFETPSDMIFYRKLAKMED